MPDRQIATLKSYGEATSNLTDSFKTILERQCPLDDIMVVSGGIRNKINTVILRCNEFDKTSGKCERRKIRCPLDGVVSHFVNNNISFQVRVDEF